MNKITIVVVDDHPLFRQGVVDSLSLEPDLLVVGQAGDGPEALALIRTLRPQVAVLDVSLPGLNGQQVLRQLLAERLPSRVILLTAYDDREQVVHAMRGGASAYCTKDIRPGELVRVIRQAAAGQFIIGELSFDRPGLESWLRSQAGGAARPFVGPGEPHYPLSGRELEVLAMVSRGLSNKEIAARMGISHQTVKNHVTSLLRKLGVEDRTQAAIYALQRGWVRLEGPESETQE